jgi:hypothetical protein
MRIYALQILLLFCLLAAPPAGAETRLPQIEPLPQFVPPSARRGIEAASPKHAADVDVARRAAEALSARFSDDRPVSNDDAVSDPKKFKKAEPAAIDSPLNSARPDARVVILRAGSARAAPGPKAAKASAAKTAANPGLLKSRKGKHAGDRPRRSRSNHVEHEAPRDLTSGAVPGSRVGWGTGLIGMLTNPAFWH